jgi:PAS domain-containing protein
MSNFVGLLDMNSSILPNPEALSSPKPLDYRLLVATIRDPLLVISPDGSILAANQSAEIMLEAPPRLGSLLWDHVPIGMTYDYAGVVDTVTGVSSPTAWCLYRRTPEGAVSGR